MSPSSSPVDQLVSELLADVRVEGVTREILTTAADPSFSMALRAHVLDSIARGGTVPVDLRDKIRDVLGG